MVASSGTGTVSHGTGSIAAILIVLSGFVALPMATQSAEAPDVAGGETCPRTSGAEPPLPLDHTPLMQDAVLMVDSSGSMVTNDPMNCRHVAAKYYIDHLASPDRVAVLDFDAACRWTGPDHHLDTAGHDGVPDYVDPKSDVDQVDSMGGTNLLCTIQGAVAELTARGNARHYWVAILLTDGLDSGGNTNSAILAAAQSAADNDIPIFTIGFGDADEVLLTDIAAITGAAYFHATNCTVMVEAYDTIYGMLRDRWEEKPSAPGDPSAQVTGGDLRVSWTLSSDDTGGAHDVSGYEVWRGDSFDATGASYTLLGTTPDEVTSLLDTGAGADGLDHFYQVRAVDLAGHSVPAAGQGAKFSELLTAGSNLVSLPLEVDDDSVASILATVPWTSVRTYRDGMWRTAYAGRPGSGLDALPAGSAFWIEVSSDAWWTLVGRTPGTTQVPLRAGWNLVGYPALFARPAAEVFAGIDVVAMERFADAPPYNLQRLDGAGMLSPGRGYWVQVRQDSILTIANA